MNPGTIHLWHVDLDGASAAHAISWLDDEERRRANSRRSPIDRARFIAAHAALRSILGDALGIPPGDVAFTSGEFRKPALAPHLNRGGWHFNMAHSMHRAIIALSRRRRVGVDIEFATRTYEEVREIMHNFSVHEREQLEEIAERDVFAFYRCWVRKEAFLKALGIGILGDMTAFSVSVDSDSARLHHVEPRLGRTGDWTLAALDGNVAAERYAASLAVEGEITEIIQHSR